MSTKNILLSIVIIGCIVHVFVSLHANNDYAVSGWLTALLLAIANIEIKNSGK